MYTSTLDTSYIYFKVTNKNRDTLNIIIVNIAFLTYNMVVCIAELFCIVW